VILFLNANVLFTASISPEGVSRALVGLSAMGSVLLASSPFAIDEARRNIALKRTGHLSEMNEVLANIDRVGDAHPRLMAWAGRFVASKDAPILAAAIGARADVLVTGDRRHFGELFGRTVHGVQIEPPCVALRLVLDSMS